MVSFANMEALNNCGVSYIVGARLGNLPSSIIQGLSSNLNRTEDIYYTLQTKCGKLVCDYSKRRATKDKSDRSKQLARAETQVKYPEQVTRRAKFVKTEAPTNLTKPPEATIVARYHDLWHVEKSFRMAKSDLLARPMFHFKRQGIEAHLLVVFVSLCLAKSLELKTNTSIKRIMELLWEIEDVEFRDTLNQDTYHKQTISDSTELKELLTKIKRAY